MTSSDCPDFRVLFESAPGLFLVLAPDLSIVAVSDAYLKATMTERDEILGRGLFDVFPDNPDDPEASGTRNLHASLERARASGAADTMEIQKYDIRRPESEGGGFEERHWSPVNTPLFDAEGKLLYFIHRVEDVTESVRLRQRVADRQAELEQTNQFLEAVLENIPHMVFVKDAEQLAFARFNRAGEILLGMPREELLGKTDYDFFPRGEAEFFQARDREALVASVLVDIPEEPIQTARGPRILHTKKVPILDAAGAPRYLLGISEDITESRAGEEARSRLAAIVESSEDAIISETLEGVVTSWNKGAESLFGYTALEMVGQPLLRIFPPDRFNEAAQLLARLGNSEHVGHFETLRRRKDGRDIDVSVRMSALRDPSGSIIGVSKIVRDITAAKRAATERASLETRATTVLNTVLDGILVFDEVGTISTFNRGAERLFGYSAGEMLGKNIEGLIPQPARTNSEGNLDKENRLAKLIGVGREVVGVRKDGGRVPIELSVTEMWVEGTRHYTGLLRDISERKEAEHAIEMQNQELKRLRDAAATDAAGVRAQLRAVLDNAPDYILSLDREGSILYVNRAIPPFTVEQLVGSKWVSHASTPEAGAARRAAIDRVLASGEAAHLTSTMNGADGLPRSFESRIGAVRLGNEIVGVAIVVRDVTEQRRTEMQLKISDRMASVGTLAAGVAHEINSPLAAVVANLELTLRDTEALAHLSTELHDGLRDARDSAERIREIVFDLKLFSRAEVADRVAPVDLRRVIDSTLRMAGAEHRHRAKVVTDYGEVPLVLANESRLGQLFLNLIVNAAQAIPEGDADHNEIRIITSTDATGRAQVEIRDTGPGMSQEVLGHLFTPFFTTKPVGVGTGLGLSICQRIVAAIGGEIHVESAMGRGTTFRVSLRPAPRDAVEPPPAVGSPPQPATRRGKILVIDDEPMIGHVIRRTLNEHDVTVVVRAQDALDLIRAGNHFDLILCDLMMPQMTGMDLYELLNGEKDSDLVARFVFLTGGAFTQRARQFLDEVPNLCLDKPFKTSHLRTIVNDQIR